MSRLVADEQSLPSSDESARRRACEAAANFVQQHRHASARTVQALQPWLAGIGKAHLSVSGDAGEAP